MNEYFPVEVYPTTVPMETSMPSPVMFFPAGSPPFVLLPFSVRRPEPPVSALGGEHAFGKGHNARITALQCLAQQNNLVLSLDATAHPLRHLGEFIDDIKADRETVGWEQAAGVKNQIERGSP